MLSPSYQNPACPSAQSFDAFGLDAFKVGGIEGNAIGEIETSRVDMWNGYESWLATPSSPGPSATCYTIPQAISASTSDTSGDLPHTPGSQSHLYEDEDAILKSMLQYIDFSEGLDSFPTTDQHSATERYETKGKAIEAPPPAYGKTLAHAGKYRSSLPEDSAVACDAYQPTCSSQQGIPPPQACDYPHSVRHSSSFQLVDHVALTQVPTQLPADESTGDRAPKRGRGHDIPDTTRPQQSSSLKRRRDDEPDSDEPLPRSSTKRSRSNLGSKVGSSTPDADATVIERLVGELDGPDVKGSEILQIVPDGDAYKYVCIYVDPVTKGSCTQQSYGSARNFKRHVIGTHGKKEHRDHQAHTLREENTLALRFPWCCENEYVCHLSKEECSYRKETNAPWTLMAWGRIERLVAQHKKECHPQAATGINRREGRNRKPAK